MKKYLTLLFILLSYLTFAQVKVTRIQTTITFSDGTTTSSDVNTGFVIALPVPIIIPPPVTSPPIVTTPPVTTGNTINVGDGSSNLIVDGTKYPAGTVVTIKSGTYNKGSGITIQNTNGITVNAIGVILDGLSQAKTGYGNSLNISNVVNTNIVGLTVQNNGYHPVYFNTKMVGLTLTNCNFINNSQAFYLQNNVVWDKTDNTVVMFNCAFRGCSFNNSSLFGGQGGLDGKSVTSLFKNIEISGCNFSNLDGGNLIQLNAVDGFNIFNNTVKNINATNNNDNRLFMLIGNGVAHDNSFDTIEGHAIAVWPVSFGSTVTTSVISKNTINNSRRYAAFEMQEFATFNIPGLTTKSNLVVDSNTVTNINTDHWTGYPGTFIDNYQFGLMGCQTTLTNNKGSNWFPVPVNNQYWNLGAPTVNTGNTYN